ncbi:hypothetical protein [Caldisericum sp.]|uniref:hypothetical protein n=1 Tax=Caldisericum sp. TaxID=2499687 RepID=UPI003D1082B7
MSNTGLITITLEKSVHSELRKLQGVTQAKLGIGVSLKDLVMGMQAVAQNHLEELFKEVEKVKKNENENTKNEKTTE